MNAHPSERQPVGIAQLVEWWLHDPAFRAEVGGDVTGAARRRGARLTAAEWALLRGLQDFLVADVAAARPARAADAARAGAEGAARRAGLASSR